MDAIKLLSLALIDESNLVPLVTTCITSLFTISLVVLGSSNCSTIATL